MVQPLKTRGLDDLNALQARARRLYGLGRINKEDFDFIEKHLSAVEVRIIEMRERMTSRGKAPF